MRVLLTLSAVLMMFYCGYWVAGSRLLLTGVEVALNDAKASGQIDYAGVSLRGFPSRFDITVDAPALTSADRQVSWSAPFLQVMALSYRPNQVIAVWPHDQTVNVAGDTIAVTTADMRASAAFGATTALPLDHTTLVATGGALASAAGWQARFTEARFATRAAGTDGTRHEIGLSVSDLALSGLPGAVPAMALHGDAVAGFSAPLDRFAGETGASLTDLSVKELTLTLGTSRLTAKGDLTITPSRTPEGRIVVSVTDWGGLLDAAVASGLIAPELAPTWSDALDRYATLSGKPETLELPLVFKSGLMSLGPFPLGPAPVF
jgi:hypothetical protein